MNSNVIFDIGMNNGDDTAYYLHKGFQVVAVEANPNLAEAATGRFRGEIAAERLIIVNAGIAREDGSMPFWICEAHSEWSSFDRSIASRDNCRHYDILVPCRTFRSVIEEFGVPFYLKVDIEGNDHCCLEGLGKENLPPYISVEASGLGLLDSLADLGYTRFKCISQFNYISLEIPPSREQRNFEFAERLLKSRNLLVRIFRRMGGRTWVNTLKSRSLRDRGWTFPSGSSGPFGEDLPGTWLDYEQTREAYLGFQNAMQSGSASPFWTDKEFSFWVDFHASK